MKVIVTKPNEAAARVVEVDDEEEVVVEFRYGEHYSALWSLIVTVSVWNGLPRIKAIETRDYWSDR